MTVHRRWAAALADHEREVSRFLAVVARIDPAASIQRFTSATDAAALALHDIDAAQPAFRVTHAYFGPLAPRTALRLLSAHTRHHARALSERYHA